QSVLRQREADLVSGGGRGGGIREIGAVVHAQLAALRVVNDRAPVQLDHPLLPGLAPGQDRVAGVALGPVKDALEAVERLDDVIVDEELPRGAEPQRRKGGRGRDSGSQDEQAKPEYHFHGANLKAKRLASRSRTRSRTSFPESAERSSPPFQRAVPATLSPKMSGQSERAKPGSGEPPSSCSSTRRAPPPVVR